MLSLCACWSKYRILPHEKATGSEYVLVAGDLGEGSGGKHRSDGKNKFREVVFSVDKGAINEEADSRSLEVDEPHP